MWLVTCDVDSGQTASHESTMSTQRLCLIEIRKRDFVTGLASLQQCLIHCLTQETISVFYMLYIRLAMSLKWGFGSQTNVCLLCFYSSALQRFVCRPYLWWWDGHPQAPKHHRHSCDCGSYSPLFLWPHKEPEKNKTKETKNKKQKTTFGPSFAVPPSTKPQNTDAKTQCVSSAKEHPSERGKHLGKFILSLISILTHLIFSKAAHRSLIQSACPCSVTSQISLSLQKSSSPSWESWGAPRLAGIVYPVGMFYIRFMNMF